MTDRRKHRGCGTRRRRRGPRRRTSAPRGRGRLWPGRGRRGRTPPRHGGAVRRRFGHGASVPSPRCACRPVCARRILVGILLWQLSASLLAFVVLTASGGLSVRRTADTWSRSSPSVAAACTSVGLRMACGGGCGSVRAGGSVRTGAAGPNHRRTVAAAGPQSAGGLGRARPAARLGSRSGRAAWMRAATSSARSPSVLKTRSTPAKAGIVAASSCACSKRPVSPDQLGGSRSMMRSTRLAGCASSRTRKTSSAPTAAISSVASASVSRVRATSSRRCPASR